MKLLNKRSLAGGLIAVGIALGLYFGNLFRGFGPGGGGGGTHVSSGNGSANRHEEHLPAASPKDNVSEESAEPRPAPQLPLPRSPGILDVVIAGETYEIRQSTGREDRVEPIELPELIERAKQSPGNEDGIRVRIFRRESSLPTSEQALDQALDDAGIPSSAIHREESLLPDR